MQFAQVRLVAIIYKGQKLEMIVPYKRLKVQLYKLYCSITTCVHITVTIPIATDEH